MASENRTVLAHPGSSYLIAAFLALCVTAMQQAPIALLLYLIPGAAALYIKRTATVVDDAGITARAPFGSSTVPWNELVGLELSASGAVYAVQADATKLRLPCVRSTRLAALVRASGGRIPDPAATV